MIKVIVNKMNTEMVRLASITSRHLDIFKKVSVFFGKEVYINYSNSEVESSGNTDIVTVNMWSAPQVTDMDIPEVDVAFGKKFCTDGVYVKEEGYITFGDIIPLVEYKNNNFYFLYDVCEYNTEDEFQLLKILVDGILSQIAGSSELVEEKIKAVLEEENKKQRKAFISKLIKKEREMRDQRKYDLQRAKESLEEHRRSVRQLVLNITSQEAMLDANNNSIDVLETNLTKELEAMRTNKKIQDVTIDTDGNLVIETKMIFSNVLGKDGKVRRYRFGEYKVVVNINGGQVYFLNQNEKDKHESAWSGKCNHPHVRPDGTACLGSASGLIVDCIDRYQWSVLADVLINFLESVNIDDGAGKYYYRWEQVDENGTRLATQYAPR